MTRIPVSPLARPEAAVANGRLDELNARAQGHVRQIEDRRFNNQPIGPTAVPTPLQPGHVLIQQATVRDTHAHGLQKRLGFDTWQHSRRVDKQAPNTTQVTDHLLWPNGSTAQRAFALRDASPQGVDVSVGPWQVQIHNVPMAGAVAGRMRQQMDAVDGKLPQTLRDAS